MIKTKNDLRRCLAMDKYALGINRKNPKLLGDEIWKFQIALRKHEYYHNCKHLSLINKFMLCYYKFRHHILGIKLGFSIPINVFDGGLKINHYGYIVVNPNAKIGCYCDIHQGVNIGTQGGGGTYHRKQCMDWTWCQIIWSYSNCRQLSDRSQCSSK